MPDTVTINGPDIEPQTQLLFSNWLEGEQITGVFCVPKGISVEFADGSQMLFAPLLVGYNLTLTPEGRIEIGPIATDPDPIAWRYRRTDIDQAFMTTQNDPMKTQTQAWRDLRIIQPLYLRP